MLSYNEKSVKPEYLLWFGYDLFDLIDRETTKPYMKFPSFQIKKKN